MSIILGALAGAGDAMQAYGAKNQAADLARENELAVGKQRSDLETQRQQTMAVFQDNLRNAPLTRLGGKAKELAGQDIPVEAAPVTALSGQDPQLSANVEGMAGDKITKGMVGNYADLVAKAKTLPIEDQQPYLDQLKRQFGADTETAQASIIGQVRKRSPDEAFKAAMDDAKVNDPIAYAAGEERIGKPMRDERRVDNQEKREETRDATTNRRLDIQQQFNEERAKHQDRLAEIAEKRASRLEGRQGDQMDKAELQSTRQALSSVLKDIATQEDKLQVRLADPMLDPEQKKLLVSQMKTLDNDRIATRNHLLELAGIAPPEPAAPPSNTWNSATGEVMSGGQVIGKASSPDEAKSMLAKAKTQASPSAEPASTAPSAPAQQFNAAGYADVQSTIDGAKRGDQKALALLQQLIDRGETSPAQRQQIAKITGQK